MAQVMGGTEADYVYSSNTNDFSPLGVHLGNTSGTDADRFWSSDVQVHGATTIRSAGLRKFYYRMPPPPLSSMEMLPSLWGLDS